MLEDRRLIDRLKRGDGEALCRIYRKYGDDLLTMAARTLRDVAAAEDILHDVFLAFAKGIERFELTGSLRGYLARCVVNAARNRAHCRASRVESLPDEVASLQRRPDQIVIADEQMRRVSEAMDELPAEQKQVVLLHVYGGLKFREIAEMHEISVNTVLGRYRYAMGKLRSRLRVEVQDGFCTECQAVG